MAHRNDGEAVLITGLFGSGKSSVAVEVITLLERRNLSYGLLDLDFLAWFGPSDRPQRDQVRLRTVEVMVSSFLDAGVRRFVLAHSVRDTVELDGLRHQLAMPLTVVRLTVPMPEIERRLRADVTEARQDDLRDAAVWAAESRGVGLEDLALSNDRPIREVATEIVEHLGWA